MKNYYDENYSAFICKHSNNDYIEEEKEECQVLLTKDISGNDLLGIRKADKDRFIGSVYDNEYFINRWVDSVEVNSYKAIIFIFGLGELKCIERLMEKLPDNQIIIYEPNVGYLKTMMETFDMKNVICNSKVDIVAGSKGLQYLQGLCFDLLDLTNYSNLVIKEMPQYRELYELERIKIELLIQETVIKLIADKNTIKAFGKERLENELANLYYAAVSNNIREVIDEIKEKKNNTAVLVSAGPSLEKNVHLLEEVKNKAFIIAVDTAIKPLLKIGIRPDITITVDSHKPTELFIYEGQAVDIPMVVYLQSNKEVLKDYRGKMFFSYNYDKLFARLYDKEDYLNIFLNSGGSVANDALSFLVECDFSNIILIGQDLAYTNKRTHIGTAYDDEKKIMLSDNKKYFEVEDIYGDKVLTEENMNFYRKWFEMVIRNNPKYNIIDATEGGAKIEGSRIMTFKEAIDEYITKLPEIDYEKIIREVELPKDEDIAEKIGRIKLFTEDIEKTQKDLKKAVSLYDEMDEMNRKGKQYSARFKKISNDVSVLMNEIQNSVLAALMSYIQDDEEFEVLGNIYENKGSLYDEMKLIIESGKKMMQKYINNIDNIKEKVENMIHEKIDVL